MIKRRKDGIVGVATRVKHQVFFYVRVSSISKGRSDIKIDNKIWVQMPVCSF